MNIYLIKRKGRTGYDEYIGAVVYAATAAEAMNMHPGGLKAGHEYWLDDWVSPESVEVSLVGYACEGAMSGVVLASYRNG